MTQSGGFSAMPLVSSVNDGYSFPLLDPTEPVPLNRNKRATAATLRTSLFRSVSTPLHLGVNPNLSALFALDGAAELKGTVNVVGSLFINGVLVTPGGGSGSVTSVGLSLPSIFTVTNSPVTTSGTLTATLNSQAEASVFAGPASGSGAPTFRALVASDIPALPYLTGNQSITLSGDVTGTGATAITTTLANSGVSAGTYNDSATAVRPFTVDVKGRITGIGSAVTITPAWSSITSKPTTLSGYGITDAQPLDADLTAIAGLAGTSGLLRKTGANTWTLDTASYLTGNQSITVSGDASGTGTTAISLTLATVNSNVGTFGDARNVPVITANAKGLVTAVTTAHIFNGVNYTWPVSDGSNNTVLTTDGAGNLSWTAHGGGGGGSGTVTSVGLALPTDVFDISGSPVTVSGTLTGSFKSQTQALFFASPASTSGVPSFRAIAATDIPTLNQNTTGNAATATALQTARTINGVSFNGTADINLVRFTGAVAQAAANIDRIDIGTESGTPRMVFENWDGSTSLRWLVDVEAGVADGLFRWYTPSVVRMALSTGATYGLRLFNLPLTWTTDNNTDIGNASDNRPRTGYFGTSVVIAGNTALHAGNYNTYAPTLTGTGASGSWGISITGTAANATVLQTSRDFSLTGDVTASAVGFNGSGNVALSTSISASTVTGKLLTGYAVGSNTAIAATDSILQAFQKAQGQINSRLTANQTITVSGDASGSGTTAITLTLATVNSNVGSFGSANAVPVITVNAKGLVTAVSTANLFNSVAYTWPATSGSNGQVLTTNGSGTLSWTTPSGGGGAGLHIGTSAPSDPAAEPFWWNSESGQLYIYYTDANTSQWVSAMSTIGSSAIQASGTVQTITTTTQSAYDALGTKDPTTLYIITS